MNEVKNMIKCLIFLWLWRYVKLKKGERLKFVLIDLIELWKVMIFSICNIFIGSVYVVYFVFNI